MTVDRYYCPSICPVARRRVIVTVRRPRLRVRSSTFDVYPGEHGQRGPKHKHEEEERVSDVPRQVGHQADDERTDKGGGL
jgi:hypothetical protein